LFPVLVHRAAVAADTEKLAELQSLLQEILLTPLSSIDYLSLSGLEKVLATLWKASELLADDDPLRAQVIDRLVASHLAPDGLFESHRAKGETVEDLNLYRCLIEQPLDERWLSWHGRMAGEEELTSYRALWGVLAASSEEAAELVLEWQARCFPLDAQVIEVELVDTGYTEQIGVVWQRFREAA
jgi:hypothetical protein